MVEKLPRRWFRFSLRTLLVVMTALCVWLGWESSVVRQRRAILREMRTGTVFQITTADEWRARLPPGQSTASVARIPLVRRWLGDEAVQEVWFTRHFQGFSQVQLDRFAAAFPEAQVHEAYPEPCHPGCFPTGTLVDTPQGPRAIESILVGERLTIILPSGRAAEGQAAEGQVQSIFVTENRLLRVATDDGELFTTETQPLCLAVDRIQSAGKLTPGDTILRRVGGEIRPTQVLAVTPTGRIERVFNLVLGNSEIFVAGGFLARSKPPAVVAAD